MRGALTGRGALLAALLCAGCGGEEVVLPEGTIEAGLPASEAVGGAVDGVPAGDGAPARRTARDVRWYVSRGERVLDGLENVIVYRSADDVSGSPDVVLYVRCLGDRTEVELDMGVALGDDDITDGEGRTKRVLVRFVPAEMTPLVYDVGPEGRSLVVERPLGFLRRFVSADAAVVQTVSRRGTAVFAEFAVTALAYENLLVVSDACGWILDAAEAARAEQLERDELFEAERAEVLATYVGTPIRDGLETFGVEYDEVFLDLPAPVHRAYLGFGVTISAIEVAMAQDLGIVCLAGTWVDDEIVLRECYVEGTFEDTGAAGEEPDPDG